MGAQGCALLGSIVLSALYRALGARSRALALYRHTHHCMIEFAASDFVSLAEFPLGWRFVPDRVADLTADILARIRPLTASRAAAVAPVARMQCEEAAAFGVTLRSDDAPGTVREQLRGLPPAASTQVLISWDARAALVTDWGVFIAHWDDFCYPSSDDVTIWPLDASWTLCYRHYEIFQFNSRVRSV